MTDEPSSSMPRVGGAELQETEQTEGLIDRFLGLVRGRNGDQERNDDQLRETLEELIEETKFEAATSVAAHERALIGNILKLRDMSVLDVMIPRADIAAIEINTPQQEVLSIMAQQPHSRLPVFRDTLDEIAGTVHIKDIVASLAADREFSLKDIVREVEIVAPSMHVLDLLLQMRQSRVHMALVVDEFGGIDGLVTINDIIEAIVGEIEDEYDIDIHPRMVEWPDGSMLADGRVPLEIFEEHYGTILDEEDREEVDTLGGLVTMIAGRVPARGEIIKHESGLEFEITEADPRKISKVIIRTLPIQPEHKKAPSPPAATDSSGDI